MVLQDDRNFNIGHCQKARSARRRRGGCRADELPALVRAELGDGALPALDGARARTMADELATLLAATWRALPGGEALALDWPQT